MVSKADKYVVFDIKKDIFYLKSEANKKLSSREIQDVKELIAQSNKNLVNIKKDKSLVMTRTEKMVNISVVAVSSNSTVFSAAAKAPPSLQAFWWGLRNYLNDYATKELTYVANRATILGGSGIGAIVYKLKKIKCPTLAGLVGSSAGYMVASFFDKVNRANQGRGIYVDQYWGLGILNLKIYSA